MRTSMIQETNAPQLWVVVADSAAAKVFAGSGKASEPLTFVTRLDHPEARVLQRASDRPGTTRSDVPGIPHAYVPHTDPEQLEQRRFARAIAALLADGSARKAFGKLVLAMPPRMLGMVRDELSNESRDAIVLELPLRLIDLPEAEISSRVRAAFAARS